jgi:hypothetical protein
VVLTMHGRGAVEKLGKWQMVDGLQVGEGFHAVFLWIATSASGGRLPSGER